MARASVKQTLVRVFFKGYKKNPLRVRAEKTRFKDNTIGGSITYTAESTETARREVEKHLPGMADSEFMVCEIELCEAECVFV